MLSSETLEHSSLADRVVRLVAIVALLYGGVGVIQELVLWVVIGPAFMKLRWPTSSADDLAMYEQLRFLLSNLSDILLVISGCGLLRLRSWGRATLIIWTLLAMAIEPVTLVSSILMLAHVNSAPAVKHSHNLSSIAYFNSIIACLKAVAMPLLLLWLMLTKEVAQSFVSATPGGFEIGSKPKLLVTKPDSTSPPQS